MVAKKTIISLMLVGLFFIAIFNFTSMLQYNNNAPNNIADYPGLNSTLGQLVNNLSDSDDKSETQKDVFEQSEISTEGGGITVTSIKQVFTVLTTIPIAVYNLVMGVIFGTVFGGGFGVVAAVIASLFLITIILAGWQLLRTGGS